MRSFTIAAALVLTLAGSANAAMVDYFNKTHATAVAGGTTRTGGGGGTGKSYQGGGSGSGKIAAHCAPGAKSKLCHR